MSPRPEQPEVSRDPLPQLQRDLEAEFGNVVPIDRINQVAKQSLGEFEDARIREFVPVFAWRRARSQLKRAS